MSDDTKSNLGASAIIFSLLACIYVYVFYRPEGTLINILLSKLLPQTDWLAIKTSVRQMWPLPKWVIFSLSGGLWVFAATMLARQLKIYFYNVTIHAKWMPMLFALWLEFWQWMGIVKGRFDWMDVLLVLLFGVGAIAIPVHNIQLGKKYIQHERQQWLFAFVFLSVFMGHVF